MTARFESASSSPRPPAERANVANNNRSTTIVERGERRTTSDKQTFVARSGYHRLRIAAPGEPACLRCDGTGEIRVRVAHLPERYGQRRRPKDEQARFDRSTEVIRTCPACGGDGAGPAARLTAIRRCARCGAPFQERLPIVGRARKYCRFCRPPRPGQLHSRRTEVRNGEADEGQEPGPGRARPGAGVDARA